MKKALSILAILGLTIMVSCGLSPEEKAAALKAKKDSIKLYRQTLTDSIIYTQKEISDLESAYEAQKAQYEAQKAQKYADSVEKATGNKTSNEVSNDIITLLKGATFYRDKSYYDDLTKRVIQESAEKLNNPLIRQAKERLNHFLLLRSRLDEVLMNDSKVNTVGGDLKTYSVADELLKLNELKEKGVITDTEFDAQKEKLLNK